jgi:hypothetical protein
VTYSPIGAYCRSCFGALPLADCPVCHPQPPAVLGSLAGMQALAKSLLVHYEINPAEHPELVDELEIEVGEELLDLAREALARHGIPVSAEVGALPMRTTGSNPPIEPRAGS